MPKLIVAIGDKLDIFEVKGMALRGVDSANRKQNSITVVEGMQ